MRGAYRIARLAGIDIKVHWSFLILLGYMFYSYYKQTNLVETGLYGIAIVLAVFACVIAHEYGHALTARAFGIRTRDITLLPIGGLASLERMPEKPKQELAVALMGPAVNLLITAALLIYLSLTNQLGNFNEGFNPLDPRFFAENLLVLNVFLVVFNLIPAFPMDGGRVLRALLAMRWERAKATRFAAGVGRTLAVGFIIYGILNGNAVLVFIGLFVYLGAGAESKQVSTRTALTGFSVSDVLMTDYTPVYVHEPIERAIELTLASQQKEFLVLDLDGWVVGVLTQQALFKAVAAGQRGGRIKDIALADPLELPLSMDLQEAYLLMMSKRASVCPVYRGRELAGMLNAENIQEFLLLRNRDITDDEEDIYDGREELVNESRIGSPSS